MSMTEELKVTLTAALSPRFLEVLNESHMHSVPRGSESHFKVVVVSEKFEGQMLLKRHRLVQGILQKEIARIKALSLHTFTPEEWANRAEAGTESPRCASHTAKERK
ncbi:MAG: BolA family transcriptional regulator [Silvanigrellales bacterium]|jgi:BolA protein|nr:BolA family transcriptional regulator [Silvanigrellales bacterium]